MKSHLQILASPQEDLSIRQWFEKVASTLFDRTLMLIGGKPHRLREIEFYYHGGVHLDPFAHRDALQKSWGRWYFHRIGSSYRGGSFKGLDITFGPLDAHGGILIRTLQSDDGTVINGCSLCVDHMLSTTGFSSISNLDEAIGERSVWSLSAPLALVPSENSPQREMISTARVGLTLKKTDESSEKPRYLMRGYRFLNELAISKGKVHTVIALHQQGANRDDIAVLTGTRPGVIEGYLNAYEEGRLEGDFKSFQGRSLKTDDLCRLHGIWQRISATSIAAAPR